MTDAPWDRILVRWSRDTDAELTAPTCLTFAALNGERVLAIRASDRGERGTDQDWGAFQFRHGHPQPCAHIPDAPYLLVVRATAASDREREDFRRWLAEEHGPRQTTIPGVRWLQAYEQDGPDHSFLNVWGLDDPAVVQGEAWTRVRKSAWWDRVRHIPAAGDRGTYRRVGQVGTPTSPSVKEALTAQE